MGRRRSLYRSVVLGTTLTLVSLNTGIGEVRAELLVGLTEENTLIRFDSATPGSVTNIGFITGLLPNDVLVGIDRRPSLGPNNGLLYALGISHTANGGAHIYTLNDATAAATLVSTLVADPADLTPPFPFTQIQSPDFMGMDFDPVTDRLRIVTDFDQNYRVNVDNGLTQREVSVAYQPGDPGSGTDPVVIAAAYTNNFGGALTTTLRGIDINNGPNRLVTFPDPDSGLLQTSATLPFNASADTTYDISGLTGTGYIVHNPGSPELYRTVPAGAELIGAIASPFRVRGLAAPVGNPVGGQIAAPEPTTAALLLPLLPAIVAVRSAASRRRRTP